MGAPQTAPEVVMAGPAGLSITEHVMSALLAVSLKITTVTLVQAAGPDTSTETYHSSGGHVFKLAWGSTPDTKMAQSIIDAMDLTDTGLKELAVDALINNSTEPVIVLLRVMTARLFEWHQETRTTVNNIITEASLTEPQLDNSTTFDDAATTLADYLKSLIQ